VERKERGRESSARGLLWVLGPLLRKRFAAWAGLLAAQREREGRVWGSSGRIEGGGGLAFGPQSRGGKFFFFLLFVFFFYFQTIFKSV